MTTAKLGLLAGVRGVSSSLGVPVRVRPGPDPPGFVLFLPVSDVGGKAKRVCRLLGRAIAPKLGRRDNLPLAKRTRPVQPVSERSSHLNQSKQVAGKEDVMSKEEEIE